MFDRLVEDFVNSTIPASVFYPRWKARLLTQGSAPRKKHGREAGLADSEIMTILVLDHSSHLKNFKTFYEGVVLALLRPAFSKSALLCLSIRRSAARAHPIAARAFGHAGLQGHSERFRVLTQAPGPDNVHQFSAIMSASWKGMTMNKEGTSIDLDAVMADPAAFFARPQDVAADQRFSREIKLKILRQWERDAHNLGVADNEGMSGGEESMHGRVLHAIRSLEEGTGSDSIQPEGKSDGSAGRSENSYRGLEKALRTAGCQILRNTREQPLAALMIAAWLGYLFGRVRHRL